MDQNTLGGFLSVSSQFQQTFVPRCAMLSTMEKQDNPIRKEIEASIAALERQIAALGETVGHRAEIDACKRAIERLRSALLS
jgi:hypothetical protein